MIKRIVLLSSLCMAARAQEASSGVELSGTVGVLAAGSDQLIAQPRDGSPVIGGFRAVLYPVWKLSEHWTISGALQVHSLPYFSEEFSEAGHDVKADLLQANLSYSRFWKNGSMVVRLGQLSSAFGSFLLRYDDAVNPLIDIPLSYGYYYRGVSDLGFTGAQVDLTLRKFDLRAQFVNSSPANRRTVFDRDQYGTWAGGAGYTITQGFRVGVSAYRGPYLDRRYPFYFPGEAKPRDLPGSAAGVDAQWGRGPWSVSGEWQRFQMDYRKIPTFLKQVGYVEARRTLHPRWYVAARAGYMRASAGPSREAYELTVGYRPSRWELVKVGYQAQQGSDIRGLLANTFTVQLVTTFGPLSIVRN